VLKKQLPHKIKSVLIEEVNKDSDELTFDTSPDNLDAALEKMQKLETTFNNLREQQPINEVESFGNEIIKIGKDTDVSVIKKYGQDIINSVNNFEIDKMLILIKQYPTYIDKLNSTKKLKA
jgi:hypothetical protein